MARNKGVSGKTHTKQQLDDYANQHNPNNKAYKAKVTNQKQIKKQKGKEHPDYVLSGNINQKWLMFFFLQESIIMEVKN